MHNARLNYGGQDRDRLAQNAPVPTRSIPFLAFIQLFFIFISHPTCVINREAAIFIYYFFFFFVIGNVEAIMFAR